jgi:thiamine biosynthesis lipoprotein
MNSRLLLASSLFSLTLFLSSCDGWLKKNWTSVDQINPETKKEVTINGFGTEITIIYLDSANRDLKPAIDSLIQEMVKAADTNSPSSEISTLNYRDTLASPSKELDFWIKKAQKWHAETGGAVEFTEKPLQEIWSFSSSGPRLRDSTDVNFFLRLVGLQKVVSTDSLIRKPSGVLIDFEKISNGIILDRIATLLKEKGISNFLLKSSKTELANGTNEKGELWKSSLTHLSDSLENMSEGLIALENKAISTWGDEKELYLRDSLKIGYSLDPRTGYPVTHGLLKATVISSEAEISDALADYFRITGPSNAIRLDSLREDIQIILLYHERGKKLNQYISPELRPFLSFPVK